MQASGKFALLRLFPVVLVTLAAAAWFNDVQRGGPWVLRNIVPLLVLVLLSWFTLHRGSGRWTGGGWRLPLATMGFAIPALGLSAYLHYAYSVNLDDMFAGSQSPGRVFRYLPAYTLVAGGIGAAIGWIVGRNI